MDSLPLEIVDDIFRRVHVLNMADLCVQLNNCKKKLASYQALAFDNWIDLIDDEMDCLPIECEKSQNFGKYNTLYRYFIRVVAKVIYVSNGNGYIVGQMDWGAWFVYHIHKSTCFIAEDINNFLENLPVEIKNDIL